MNSMVQSGKQVNSYTARDMMDAHEVAQSRMLWVAALISTVKQNQKDDKEWLNKELLEITQYLTETFADEHDEFRQKYESEWKSRR